jgi:segregation and condensation protein B
VIPLLESILFVAGEAVPTERLRQLLGASQVELDGALTGLGEQLRFRGIRLQLSPTGVQLVTAPEHARPVERFLGIQAATKLSSAALETLAIVAYRQPISRSQLEGVRGVNSERVLRALVAQGLLQELGRASGVGRPMQYGTTDELLQRFGLSSLAELPPL